MTRTQEPTNTDFYSTVPTVSGFEELVDSSVYVPVPDDWLIAVADVMGSTKAIEAGRYKAVNTVGVSVIAAITNALRPIEVPYVFGGDGALVLVPGSAEEAARDALAATAAMAGASFGLQLRTGLVPVRRARSEGYDVRIVRHRVSPDYVQCALFGGGVEYVERALKDGSLPADFMVQPDATQTADYSGLECRWRNVPSPRDETISLIVDASVSPERQMEVYGKVVDRITEIYGAAEECRPVDEEGLSASLSQRELRYEAGVRTHGASGFSRFLYRVNQLLGVVAGWFFMRFRLRVGDVDWSRYKRDLVANTDFRKFDGCLRLVFSGAANQRDEISEYLESLATANQVSYGIHVSRSAIVTCLIERRQGGHFHFVDGGDGGYAAAAARMKGVGV